MKKYTVTANRRMQERKLFAYIDETQQVQYDFAPWETDNGTVTAVTWTTKQGQAGISNEALASSKATATITTSQEGKSQIEVKAVAGNNTFVTYLEVVCKDPKYSYNQSVRYSYY